MPASRTTPSPGLEQSWPFLYDFKERVERRYVEGRNELEQDLFLLNMRREENFEHLVIYNTLGLTFCTKDSPIAGFDTSGGK